MNMKRFAIQFVLPIFLPAIKMYWRIVKPKTFGVRVLVLHPNNDGRILLVRHSYGNKTLWNIPGGGYRPNKEKPLQAAVREMKEEFNQDLVDPQEIGLYETSGEGKRDTVVLIAGTFKSAVIDRLDSEISEISWEYWSDVVNREDVARVARRAIEIRFKS